MSRTHQKRTGKQMLWLCCLAWLTTSCELLFPDEEPTDPIEYVYVDDDFWRYVGLPENSYWIYREINTGEIDSSYSGGNHL